MKGTAPKPAALARGERLAVDLAATDTRLASLVQAIEAGHVIARGRLPALYEARKAIAAIAADLDRELDALRRWHRGGQP